MEDYHKTKILIKRIFSVTGEPLPEYERQERVETVFIPLDEVQYYFEDTGEEYENKDNKTRAVFYDGVNVILVEDIVDFHRAKQTRERYLNKLKIQLKFN